MRRTARLLTLTLLLGTILPPAAFAGQNGQATVAQPQQRRTVRRSTAKTPAKPPAKAPVKGTVQKQRVPRRSATSDGPVKRAPRNPEAGKQRVPRNPTKDPGRNPRNPGRGDDVGGSSGQPGKGDDVGGQTDGHGHGDDVHPYPPKPPDRPERPPRRPPRRPSFGITIGIDPFPGSSSRDEKEKKDKKEKKEKVEEAPAEPVAARPLKYDGRAYRRMIDGLLSQGKIDAALMVLELLKEQEYYEYTGSFGDIASVEAAPAGGDGTTFAGLDVVRVKKKKASKKGDAPAGEAVEAEQKGKKKGKKGKADDEASAKASGKKGKGKKKDEAAGPWEQRLEARADALLALQQEAASLRAVPVASRTATQNGRLAVIEAEIAAASRDLEAALAAISAELGAGDPRVKRLRNADLLTGALALSPATAAIYTVVAEERFWTIVVSATSRAAYSTPIRADELNRKVLAFRDVLVNPKLDPVPLAAELYNVVVRPAERDPALASASTLLWSFDGVLRYVPVVALHDGQRYLVERYRNAVFNRASLVALVDSPSGRTGGVGLGVARQVGSFSPLPAVADELQGIFVDASVGGDEGAVPGRVLLDTSFTEAALEGALRGDNPVVHIATHFQLSPGNADDSLLLLGDGSLVNVGDIRQIKGGFRDVDLLTLSACNTAASGPAADGREVESFGTIAQERGAKAVIASLWPVNDRSTSQLMQSFYRMRASSPGETKAELLRRAQRELLSGVAAGSPAGAPSRALVHTAAGSGATAPPFTPDPAAPFAHPYYWAPFVLIGNFR